MEFYLFTCKEEKNVIKEDKNREKTKPFTEGSDRYFTTSGLLRNISYNKKNFILRT